jgi:thiamine-phosphate diphosphorylase
VTFDVYLVTDPDAPGGVVEVTRRALEAAPHGRVAVQLRAKDRTADERERLGTELRAVTSAFGAPLLVNGDPSLARRIGADGVHLPERSITVVEARATAGEGAIVSVSCHDLAGVRAAACEGASFAVLGPFAETPHKGAPLGADAFGRIARAGGLPVLALGGIDAANASLAVRAGAAGVAVIRAVYHAKDPAGAVRALVASLDTARAGER